MDHPDYQKTQGGAPSAQKSPPNDISDQQPPPNGGPAPSTMGSMDYPTLPYQPHCDPQSAVPSQGFILQPAKPIAFAVPVNPTHEREYLAYSIFTTVCCFLPLGVVALIYSIKTREANRIGDGTAAQEGSKMARRFAHAALGVGIALTLMCTALLVIFVLVKNHKPLK